MRVGEKHLHSPPSAIQLIPRQAGVQQTGDKDILFRYVQHRDLFFMQTDQIYILSGFISI